MHTLHKRFGLKPLAVAVCLLLWLTTPTLPIASSHTPTPPPGPTAHYTVTHVRVDGPRDSAQAVKDANKTPSGVSSGHHEVSLAADATNAQILAAANALSTHSITTSSRYIDASGEVHNFRSGKRTYWLLTGTIADQMLTKDAANAVSNHMKEDWKISKSGVNAVELRLISNSYHFHAHFLTFISGKDGSDYGYRGPGWGRMDLYNEILFEGYIYLPRRMSWNEDAPKITVEFKGCLPPRYVNKIGVLLDRRDPDTRKPYTVLLLFNKMDSARYSDSDCQSHPNRYQKFTFLSDEQNPFPRRMKVSFYIWLNSDASPPLPDCLQKEPTRRRSEAFTANLCSHIARSDDRLGFDVDEGYGMLSNASFEVDDDEYEIRYFRYDTSSETLAIGLENCLMPSTVRRIRIGNDFYNDVSSLYDDSDCYHHPNYDQELRVKVNINPLPPGGHEIGITLEEAEDAEDRPSQDFCERAWRGVELGVITDVDGVQDQCGDAPTGYIPPEPRAPAEETVKNLNHAIGVLEAAKQSYLEAAKQSYDPDPDQVRQATAVIEEFYAQYGRHSLVEGFEQAISSANNKLQQLGIEPSRDTALSILLGALCGQFCIQDYQDDIAYVVGWLTVGVIPGVSISADSRDLVASGFDCVNAISDPGSSCDVADLFLNALDVVPFEFIPGAVGVGIAVDATKSGTVIARLAKRYPKAARLLIRLAYKLHANVGLHVMKLTLPKVDVNGLEKLKDRLTSTNAGNRRGAEREIDVLYSGRYRLGHVKYLSREYEHKNPVTGKNLGTEYDFVLENPSTGKLKFVEVHSVGFNSVSTKIDDFWKLRIQISEAARHGNADMIFELFHKKGADTRDIRKTIEGMGENYAPNVKLKVIFHADR